MNIAAPQQFTVIRVKFQVNAVHFLARRSLLQDFTTLFVWRKGHALTLSLYSITGLFPKQDLFGLTSQIRRAAASIPANIAEGCGSAANSELRQIPFISLGSASELQYHVPLARDLNLLSEKQFAVLDPRIAEIKRMLFGLIEKIKKS
jgi:four helix bundle protein